MLLAVDTSFCACALGFQSIYLARTYQNGLGRQRFIVDRSLTNLSAEIAPAEFEPTGTEEFPR